MKKDYTVTNKFKYQCYGCTNDIGEYPDNDLNRVLTCPICKMTQKAREELYIVL
jgi:hypothetical protein